MTIVIYGNPVSGFCYVGPFDDQEKAIAYADEYITQTAWWTVELENPEATDEEIERSFDAYR